MKMQIVVANADNWQVLANVTDFDCNIVEGVIFQMQLWFSGVTIFL